METGQRIPESLLVWTKTKKKKERVSLQEVKSSTALHSEVEAEQSHQDQDERAERPGCHGTPVT